MTPAEEIRRAAHVLRTAPEMPPGMYLHTCGCVPSQAFMTNHGQCRGQAIGLALADWLETTARKMDDRVTCDDPRGSCNHCQYDAAVIDALGVAREVNGAE